MSLILPHGMSNICTMSDTKGKEKGVKFMNENI